MKFILTIDTEADNQWDSSSDSLSLENIREIPRFQKLCDEYGIKPTYLVTSEVAQSPMAQDILGEYRETGRAEIGAHLHPWTTEPFSNKENVRSRHFINILPQHLIRKKLETLTAQIEAGFERRPKSYRAGRFGFDGKSLECLEELKYIVDCSVTPLVNWSNANSEYSGPDFREAPIAPYYPSKTDVCQEGNSTVLEVPVTILYTKWPLTEEWGRKIFANHRSSYFTRFLNKVYWGMQPLWLRPRMNVSTKSLIRLVKICEEIGLPAVEMMFHSSELVAGANPYFTDTESVNELFKKLDALFRYLSKETDKETLTEFSRKFN